MAKGNAYQDEAEVNRFVRIGLAAFIVLVAGGFLMKHLADRQLAADDPGTWRPRTQAAGDAPARPSGPLSSFQSEPAAGMSADERILRWRQSQENEVTATGSTATPQFAPAPSRP